MSWGVFVAGAVAVCVFGCGVIVAHAEMRRRRELQPFVRDRAAYRQHWDAEPFDARYWITGVWLCPDALCGSFVSWSVFDDDEAVERAIEEHERRAHGIE